MAKKWTIFWKGLDIKIVKRNRTLRTYRVKTDINALKRIGISREVAEEIFQRSQVYNDPLFFHHLSLFFRRDADTTVLWLGAVSKDAAFVKLFELIDPNDLNKTKRKLLEITLVLKYHKKGEGWHYESDLLGSHLPAFDPKALVMSLNRMDKNAQYRYLGSAMLGPDHLFAIEKAGGGNPSVYKFIKLSPSKRKIGLTLSMDSAKEYYKAKQAVERALGLYFDSPQSKRSLEKFESFLISGESNNFILSGATYFDDTFKISVNPIQKRPANVAVAATFRQKIRASSKKTESIASIRLSHTQKGLSKPVTINILSYRTAGIIGAIHFVPNDRNLSDSRRRKLKEDFDRDFGISLNEYVTYDDLDEIGIYRILLEGTPQRVDHVDLRSSSALSIYKGLLKDSILQPGSTVEEQARFCVNRNCEDRFRVVWERKFCANCGDPLVFGKRLYTQTVDEESIVNYLRAALTKGAVTKFRNMLIKRELFIAKIEDGENVAELIPLTTRLQDHQLEVLKFRYPDLVIITSLDNWEHYNSLGFRTLRLYELIHNIKRRGASLIWKSLEQANASRLAHTRLLARDAVGRITDNSFYGKKNQLSKYLGAEFFEADCSALLNYVFGNCLWLGAKYRGTSVPDGFTAFPLSGSRNGCFIWDAKYGEGRTLQMGNFGKNKTYIENAKKAKSIRDNGGLKGFVFISNKAFPKKFETKYRSLVRNSRVKLTFLSASQLYKITEHFRKYESLISNNEDAKAVFMDSMRAIFFIVNKSQNPRIIQDREVSDLLAVNQAAFRKFKAGRGLKFIK